MKARHAFALFLALGVSACSDGGESSSAPTVESLSTTTVRAGTSTTATSTTTAPEEDLLPTMEDLIDRYDASVASILESPSVAADPAHPATSTYLALFPSASDFPQSALDFWASEGEQGHSYRPGPRGRMYDSTVQRVDRLADDRASLFVCTARSLEVVDASGSVVSAEGGTTAGDVVVVRQGDQWLIQDLTRAAPDSCPREAGQ